MTIELEVKIYHVPMAVKKTIYNTLTIKKQLSTIIYQHKINIVHHKIKLFQKSLDIHHPVARTPAESVYRFAERMASDCSA